MPFNRSLTTAAATVMGIALLSGCGSDVTMHEPGVYKGGRDVTASVEAAEQREDDLRDRALTGFADR